MTLDDSAIMPSDVTVGSDAAVYAVLKLEVAVAAWCDKMAGVAKPCNACGNVSSNNFDNAVMVGEIIIIVVSRERQGGDAGFTFPPYSVGIKIEEPMRSDEADNFVQGVR
mmetsp:Transcript_11264/g.24026  ORF Transcript_11264/g.24026 Transcript_11264/m.24026 type:complete len:110 (+) Transcript_11264:1192-1521(+)